MTYRTFLRDALRQAHDDHVKNMRRIQDTAKLDYSIYKLQEETKKKNDPARIRKQYKTRSEANRRYREKKHPDKPSLGQRLENDRIYIKAVLDRIPPEATKLPRDYMEYLICLDRLKGPSYTDPSITDINPTFEKDRDELHKLIEKYCK
jgi:hypothetical protein